MHKEMRGRKWRGREKGKRESTFFCVFHTRITSLAVPIDPVSSGADTRCLEATRVSAARSRETVMTATTIVNSTWALCKQ